MSSVPKMADKLNLSLPLFHVFGVEEWYDMQLFMSQLIGG